MRQPTPACLALAVALILAACKSAPAPNPPPNVAMPEAPTLRLDDPPAAPQPPQPPTKPGYSLPKATDVDWRTVWREDFVNDSVPATLPKQVGSIAVVMPTDAAASSRLGVISSLLSIELAVADHGTFGTASLQLLESTNEVTADLTLVDPVGRWTLSPGNNKPAVTSVFVVSVYAHEQVRRTVTKFDIGPHLARLADFNAKAIAHNAACAAYVAARARPEQDHAHDLRRHAQWRLAMEQRIATAIATHQEASDAAERDYVSRWLQYQKECERRREPAVTRAELSPKPFVAPKLNAPAGLVAATATEEAHPLSLDEMRALLEATAAEAVPAKSIRLGGQFVDTKTGMSVATIDAKLVLPAEAGKSEAGMLRELMLRLVR
ncbi:MAG: hypothetical protein ACK58X_20740 [Planctomycetota bacterium]